MTELGQKRGDERGEQTGTTGRVKAERECPYLLINRPFRKGKTPKIPRGRKERGGEGGAGDDGGEEGREGAGTSNSFSESLSFSGRRFLGVQG